MPRPKAGVLSKVCARCGTRFETPDKKNYREKQYCTKACSNAATAGKRAAAIRANEKYRPPICPCGKAVDPAPGQQYVYARNKKYCSPEHRALYQSKRQKDPSKWVTFNCLVCGNETARRKSIGNANKFCSNECAAKHTKIKVHYVLRDSDVVLDSSWEGLFYCLLRYKKIPVERHDRSTAVEWSPGHWYAPDFVLPTLGLAVEVKGHEDPEDALRWAAYRATGRRLLVVGEPEMDLLLKRDEPEGLLLDWVAFA